ncbi:MAG TPA: imelysin family protein [Polyangiaceae bacterium]|nr:imelysin family protein [Polyangiaceae bacterium]
MKHVFRSTTPLILLALGSVACGNDPEAGSVSQAQVVADYATLVEASYADSLASAVALHDSLHDFTSDPSAATLQSARDAWLASRNPYGQTEAFRFYEGPIDNEDDGPEGLINAWPIDEAYIDYVVDAYGMVVSGGIINLPDDYPDITTDVLAGLNEMGGEANISTGYHAIEFLLWGQDLSADGPGDRPYTDYVTGDEGTAGNQDRRADYLLKAADLLLENLGSVHAQWQDGKANYRADFLALEPADALSNILVGMVSLAKAELSGERMRVAWDLKEQENEHSCFSDNTKADLKNNALSVQNVLLGRYGDIDGAGIDELVEAKNAALAQQLREEMQQAIDDIEAIPAPFDTAILGDDDAEGRIAVDTAVNSLVAFATTLEEAAGALGIELKLK